MKGDGTTAGGGAWARPLADRRLDPALAVAAFPKRDAPPAPAGSRVIGRSFSAAADASRWESEERLAGTAPESGRWLMESEAAAFSLQVEQLLLPQCRLRTPPKLGCATDPSDFRVETMGLMDFTLRRLAPAAGASALAAWAGITTLNDDWDDYLGSAPAARAAGDDPERIVILSSGWAALNALRKCASAGRSVVVVSPRPHFLYTPLLASSSVGTITLRSACEPLRGLVESAAGRCAPARRSCARTPARSTRAVRRSGPRRTRTGWSSRSGPTSSSWRWGHSPTRSIPGVREHGLFLKEAEDSAKLRARLLSNLEKAAALSHQGNRYAAEIHEAATSGCLASCAPRSYCNIP